MDAERSTRVPTRRIAPRHQADGAGSRPQQTHRGRVVHLAGRETGGRNAGRILPKGAWPAAAGNTGAAFPPLPETFFRRFLARHDRAGHTGV